MASWFLDTSSIPLQIWTLSDRFFRQAFFILLLHVSFHPLPRNSMRTNEILRAGNASVRLQYSKTIAPPTAVLLFVCNLWSHRVPVGMFPLSTGKPCTSSSDLAQFGTTFHSFGLVLVTLELLPFLLVWYSFGTVCHSVWSGTI